MDAGQIADALISGSDLTPSQLKHINATGDFADRLYVRLFNAVRSEMLGSRAAKDVAAMCPHPPTAKAWLHILRYTAGATRTQYQRIVLAAEASDQSSSTVIRLAPLVLSGAHRHMFAKRIEQGVGHEPELSDDVAVAIKELRQRGPARLYVHRQKALRRACSNVRFPPL